MAKKKKGEKKKPLKAWELVRQITETLSYIAVILTAIHEILKG